MNESGLDLRIGFESDPDAGFAADPDLAASWGWFELWVGGVNLCRHAAGSHVADRVHWYLLPLLEWFVRNRERMFHEERIPDGLTNDRSARESWLASRPFDLEGERAEWVEGWLAAHSLRSAAHGGILPDVFFRRYRNDLEVSWGHASSAGIPAGFRFLAPAGTLRSPASAAAGNLQAAIGTAIAGLSQLRASPRIGRLVADHAALARPERSKRAQWLAGLKSAVEWATRLLPSTGELVVPVTPPPLALFGSLSPSIEEAEVQNILELMRSAEAPEPDEWKGRDGGDADRAPWEQGYEWAEIARLHLRLPEHTPPKIHAVIESLGIVTRDVELADQRVRAIALCGERYRPTIAVNSNCPNNRTSPGRRFTLAHELCHLLFDQERGVPLAAASGPWAPNEIEKRANAFAAMFLMPASACRSEVNRVAPAGVRTEEQLRDIAVSLNASRLATLRHLRNLELIESAEAEMLEEGIGE